MNKAAGAFISEFKVKWRLYFAWVTLLASKATSLDSTHGFTLTQELFSASFKNEHFLGFRKEYESYLCYFSSFCVADKN